MNQKNVLVLTIGTGDVEKPEASLLNPLSKSIAQGEWNEAVLLPSTVTKTFAVRLQEQFLDLPVRIEPLPKPKMENDADACFGYFDKVLGDLIEDGYTRENITVDFTRGTKAMSAALVLAAVRRDIPQLRYIHGKRDKRGMVISGSETISGLSATLATARRQLDTVIHLMHRGNFAAVLKLIPKDANRLDKIFPETFREEATELRRRAYFYAAWDRLDYKEAMRRATYLLPTDGFADEIAWLCGLANEPDRSQHGAMAKWLQIICCDLLSNGRRCIKNRHYEDALLRGYRVLELIGQFLLFERGMDSACLDSNHPAVQCLQEKLKKGRSHGLGHGKKGCLTAGRDNTARLLKILNEPLAIELLDFDKKHTKIKAKQRNHSILIHGFTATSGSDASALANLYDHLESLLTRSCPEAIARARAVTDSFPRH